MSDDERVRFLRYLHRLGARCDAVNPSGQRVQLSITTENNARSHKVRKQIICMLIYLWLRAFGLDLRYLKFLFVFQAEPLPELSLH